MDWCAIHFLPPDKPIMWGLAPRPITIFGHDVTWLDLAVFLGYPLAAAIALFLWTGNWIWFPAVAMSMAFAFIVWGWK